MSMTQTPVQRPRRRAALVGAIALHAMVALTTGIILLLSPVGAFATSMLGGLLTVTVFVCAFLVRRSFSDHQLGRFRGQQFADRVHIFLATSREWLWAMDETGRFTYSNEASAGLLGYKPSDLIGQRCTLVIGVEDLAVVRDIVRCAQNANQTVWEAPAVHFRRRDGLAIWLEISGNIQKSAGGYDSGFEGICRVLPPQTAHDASVERSRKRIGEMISRRMLVTAFQPIHDLASGRVIGAEALSRFVCEDGAGAEHWFKEAAAVGLTTELELAAIESALTAALALPSHLYVALNTSPAACLEPRLHEVLATGTIPLNRLVLELTERLEVEEYDPLTSALTPLRQSGLRIAVDDAGSGFASMRHILRVRPDIIKLDRSLIAGIDEDQGQRALGAAMVSFTRKIGASLVAEGIETEAELAIVTGLEMTAGQGYILGRPSVNPREWATWDVTNPAQQRVSRDSCGP